MNQDQQVKAVLAPAPARGHHVRERGEVQQAVSLARTFVVSDGVEAPSSPCEGVILDERYRLRALEGNRIVLMAARFVLVEGRLVDAPD